MRVVLAASFLVATGVHAAGEARGVTELHTLMYQILNEYSLLQPYIVNERAFESPANGPEITKRIDELAKLSVKVIRRKELQALSYKISGVALDEHIQEIKKVYTHGSKKYARWMLSAIPFACASCHTQLPDSPKPLWQLGAGDVSGLPLDRAEFLFATRNYDAAEEIYSTLIRTYGSAGQLTPVLVDQGDLEKAFKKKLTIWVRVKRDFKGAKSSLEVDLKKKQLPEEIRTNVKYWSIQLSALSKKKAPRTTGEVLKLAENTLPLKSGYLIGAQSPELVGALWVSGLLYEKLLNEPESDSTPELLYWLAIVDQSLNNEFFFSLGTTYLRECLRKYPKNPVALRCYGELEYELGLLYTGTRGTDLPLEVIEELKRYRTKLGITPN